MEPKIVFEDKWILVVEKPAGIVTVRAETVKGFTLQEWIEDQFPISSDFVRRAGIVHRLDKETSGLLLVAKTPETFENLQRQFKERKVRKKYLALVHGKVVPREGEIRVPVGRLTGKGIRFGVRPGGKEAGTKYRVMKVLGWGWVVSSESGNEDEDEERKKIRKTSSSQLTTKPTTHNSCSSFTFLEVLPQTGRTHQIRVHLKYFGHPIVADLKYGGKRAKKDRAWCPRLFLHAAYLGFSHPQTGKWMEFGSDLPEDLRRTLEVLLKVEVEK